MGHFILAPLKHCLLLFVILTIILLTASGHDLCRDDNLEHFPTFFLGPLTNRFLIIETNLESLYDLPLSAFKDHCLHLYQGSPVAMSETWLKLFTSESWLLYENIDNGIVIKFPPNETAINEAVLFSAWNQSSSQLTTFMYNLDSASTSVKFKPVLLNETIIGVWLSSDEMETFYSLSNNGSKLTKFTNVIFNNEEMVIDLDFVHYYMCNATDSGERNLKVIISSNPCKQPMFLPTIHQGFLFENWFYLLDQQQVLIFNVTKALSSIPSTVIKRSYTAFFRCRNIPKPQPSPIIKESKRTTNLPKEPPIIPIFVILIIAIVFLLFVILHFIVKKVQRRHSTKPGNNSRNMFAANMTVDEYYY